MSTPYAKYLHTSLNDLQQIIQDAGCRPIVFVGSGMSRRYLDAPDWQGLLKLLIANHGGLSYPYGWYFQESKSDLPTLASLLVKGFQDSAWTVHKARYPDALFETGHSADAFLKHAAAQVFVDACAKGVGAFEAGTHPMNAEISALRDLRPHALITTNYDSFLEYLFPEYDAVIGQQIIRRPPYASLGEILKIHGCVTQPDGLVLTAEDYGYFADRQKYLAANLLTYFVEFPMIFIGYSASDRNIQSILRDISVMVPAAPDECVDNIWFVTWTPAVNPGAPPATEKVLDLGDGRTVRVRTLVVESFLPLFQALSLPTPVPNVPVKLLRAVSSHVYDLTNAAIALPHMNVNLALLTQLSDKDHLNNVLGFSDVAPADQLHAARRRRHLPRDGGAERAARLRRAPRR